MGPEETSAQRRKCIPWAGVELALPEAEGRFTVVPHPEEGAWQGRTCWGCTKPRATSGGLEEDGRLWGSLFTLVRYEAADYESLLAYGTEPEAFARDADGRYYSFTDTDGSLYRGRTGPPGGGGPVGRAPGDDPPAPGGLHHPQRPGAL